MLFPETLEGWYVMQDLTEVRINSTTPRYAKRMGCLKYKFTMEGTYFLFHKCKKLSSESFFMNLEVNHKNIFSFTGYNLCHGDM